MLHLKYMVEHLWQIRKSSAHCDQLSDMRLAMLHVVAHLQTY